MTILSKKGFKVAYLHSDIETLERSDILDNLRNGEYDILVGIKKYYEDYHNTKITQDAIDEAIKLSVKYQTDKKLPDKAIDLIDLACSRFNLKLADERVITEREIQYELAKMVQIPEEQVSETESANISKLQDNVSADVFGQE